MRVGITKLLLVAVAYAVVYAAELFYDSGLYYAVCSLCFLVVTFASITSAVRLKSELIIWYGAVYLGAALLYLFMSLPVFASVIFWLFYQSTLNYSSIIFIADCVILVTGAVNVIVSIGAYLRNSRSNSARLSNARVGLH